ncbi:hypothetical protein ACFQ8C_17680 [Streptomyces sp. NPDC056503]|uniref:hypothetical protein n=1 Tax=Streptomyces sp. NPDC056503 TaxID=3345842 RepID=UPI0036868CAB
MSEDTRDPLARALFPEDGPRDAGDDPEVARALADVALIRERLGVLAAALTAEPVPTEPGSTGPVPTEPGSTEPGSAGPVAPEPGPPEPEQEQEREPGPAERAVRPRRRGRIAAWALAACVALGALGTGGAWLAARPGGLDGAVDGAGDAKLTPAGIVACATDVAEGTVVRAEPLAEEGEFRVVLRVERAYKPAGGGGELTFTGWAAEGSFYRAGTRMLVVVSRFPDEGALTFRQDMEPPGELGEDVGPVRDELEYGRKWVEAALPDAAGAPCPGRG